MLTKRLFHLGGPINQNSISCAEDLNYKIIENDKYGFKKFKQEL